MRASGFHTRGVCAEESSGRERAPDRTYQLGVRAGGTEFAPADNDAWDGYICNAYSVALTHPENSYRERFVLNMPAIEGTAREATEIAAFWNRHGPVQRAAFLSASTRTRRELGPDRPIAAYLDHLERQIHQAKKGES